MPWQVLLHPDFAEELLHLDTAVRREIAAMARLLQHSGPHLGRPRCDTLKGSKHANMKELRFNAADGVWRVAFAFDPQRRAVLLVAGDKSGTGQAKFYKALIRTADKRLNEWVKE